MALLRTSRGHSIKLPPSRVSVGESAVNVIPIAQGYSLAAVHFHLQPWDSGYFLEDAGSGLGTLVNGNPMTWAPLKHGDVITAGSLNLVYEDEDGPPLPSAPRMEATVEANLSPEAPAVPVPEQPPSWLPAEALLPPISPIAQAAAAREAATRPKRTGAWKLLLVLILAAIAAGGWYLLLKK